MSVTPGQYKAKISNYGITNTKAGDPQVAVLFDIQDQDGTPREMTWYGTFKEGKGRDITLRALLTMGMRSDDFEKLAEGITGNVLNAENPVNLSIEDEPGQDGKTYAKIRWINPVGGSAFRDKMTKDQAKVKLGALNLRGAMALIKQEMGVKDEPKKPAQTRAVPGVDYTSEDIPF